MLLCPYGSGVNYINHNRILVNVKVQWAPHGMIGQKDDAFLQNLTELFENKHHRLAFDYVALRDIEEGEELFLDYQVEWETAWNEHVTNFEQLKLHQDRYQSAFQFNLENGSKILKTEKEQEQDPYPANLELRCHPLVLSSEMMIVPHNLRDFYWDVKKAGIKCYVLGRTKLVDLESEGFVYHIGIDEGYNLEYAPEDHPKKTDHCIELEGIPRTAVSFFDAPYTSNLYLEGAFRHPVGIPDEMFPSAWKTT